MTFGVMAALLAGAAPAQTTIISDKPEKISVTLYRAPDRGADDPIDIRRAQGFALITETRTIMLPTGPTVVRFEGVAGNIMPETAIVTGLPQDVIEKNLDADLLSPRTLYDRALGRRVLIRRTDKATGRVVEQQATIRSSAAGAAVVEVAGGYEALRCSGIPETIVHPSVPAGLSARPTLSIATSAARPVTATVTLSYLAGGFDWQADYVVSLRSDRAGGADRADVTAWVTLASSDVTSLPDARTQLVAGKPNREETPSFGNYQQGALTLRCWPTAVDYGRYPPPPPFPPPPAPMAMAMESADIVVTGARRMSAPAAVIQSEIGDFKLYTVPMPTTVASKAQKQVALMTRAGVAVRIVYVSQGIGDELQPAHPVLRMRNRVTDGLGAPLPAGQVRVFQEGAERPILLGTTSLDDKAVNEEVELDLPATPGVFARVDHSSDNKETRRYSLTVSNGNPWPIAYEARFATGDDEFAAAGKTVLKDGKRIWVVTVPANGRVVLDYFRRLRD